MSSPKSKSVLSSGFHLLVSWINHLQGNHWERFPGTSTNNPASLKMLHLPSIKDKGFCSSEGRLKSKFILVLVIQDPYLTLSCTGCTFQRACLPAGGRASDREQRSRIWVDCSWKGAEKIDQVMTWQGCPLQVRSSPLRGDLGLAWVKCFSKWGFGSLAIESSGDACEESDSWDPPRSQLLINSGLGAGVRGRRGVAWECAWYQKLCGDSSAHWSVEISALVV